MVDIKQIIDGIFQLKLPLPYDLKEVNCYLIQGESGYTVFDTGDLTEDSITAWKQVLDSGCKIEKVVITHLHADHMGLGGWFQKQGIPVWMSDKSRQELSRIRTMFAEGTFINRLDRLLELHGGLFPKEHTGEYDRVEVYSYDPDYIFTEKDRIQIGKNEYEAIWTPGHSPDHFSFIDKEHGIFISGDHILKSMNPIVLSESVDDNPLLGYIEALDKINGLQPDLILPGHGEIFHDLSERISTMRTFYKKRWTQIVDSISKESKTAFQISNQLYGEGHSYERMVSAFIQTITNLAYLNSKGIVKKEYKDNIIYYRQP